MHTFSLTDLHRRSEPQLSALFKQVSDSLAQARCNQQERHAAHAAMQAIRTVRAAKRQPGR